MLTISTILTRSSLDSLACVNVCCELYGQAGRGNLTVRKVYGADRIRYLRCRVCRTEFSARKPTALWNTKVCEAKAVAVGEHLAEGCSLKGTARLVKVDASTVRRLNQRPGEHGQHVHAKRVQAVEVEALEADKRHGYATHKGQPAWEAERMDPVSKFVIAHVQGRRNEALMRTLLTDGARRLAALHKMVLLTDGEASYATLFPEIFGQPYRPSRSTHRGRPPKLRFRIPRSPAHVQVVKHRIGRRVTHVEIRHAHGAQQRVIQALEKLGYQVANTSAIERRHGTARTLSAHQVRKSLASWP